MPKIHVAETLAEPGDNPLLSACQRLQTDSCPSFAGDDDHRPLLTPRPGIRSQQATIVKFHGNPKIPKVFRPTYRFSSTVCAMRYATVARLSIFGQGLLATGQRHDHLRQSMICSYRAGEKRLG